MNKEHVFYVFLIAFAVILIYFASQTKLLGEDESSYMLIGKEIKEGYFRLFKDNGKPFVQPFVLPIVFAIFFLFFGYSLVVGKIVISLFAVGTMLVMYLAGKKINFWFGVILSFLIILVPLFTNYSLLCYTEIPIAFFSALVLLFFKVDNKRSAVVLGLIIGIGYFMKFSFLVVALTLFLYSIIFRKKYYLIASLIALSLVGLSGMINICLYNHPYIYGLELIFPTLSEVPKWVVEISPTISFQLNGFELLLSFGISAVFLLICGFLYLFYSKDTNERLVFSIMVIILFFLAFIFLSFHRGMDIRYLIVLVPFLIYTGGYFLFRLVQNYTYLVKPVLIILIVLSLYVSVSKMVDISGATRYDTDFLSALNWIRTSTPKNSTIFNILCGATNFYSERRCIWTIEDFPELMRSSNITRVKEILNNNSIDYVLITKGYVANDITVPGSNFIGMFTNNFAYLTINNLQTVYQNENNIILKVNG